MANRQSSNIWAVTVSDKTKRGRVAPFNHLWILATDAETATRKTKRWLKQNAFVGWEISKVDHRGQIDVF
jgi:hypothetical protein